ncbi:hypothetical protein LVJ94_26620 [Pendulispora rubella]|uniref:Uncharacterized protein n=1 Tax=Pendulispora rubella TaxID=2741070 RepID=A0ABZ2KPP2_9BACT
MNANDLAAATAVLRRHEAAVMSIPGVYAMGVGSAADHGGADAPCIVVHVTRDVAPGSVPASLEGIPVFVLVGEPPRLQSL